MSKIWSSELMYLFLATVIGFYWVNSISFNQQLGTMCKALDKAWWGLQRTCLQGANILVQVTEAISKLQSLLCLDKGLTQHPLFNTASRKKLFSL